MSLEMIGAGLGRTGTTSLKLALEQLLAQKTPTPTPDRLAPDRYRLANGRA